MDRLLAAATTLAAGFVLAALVFGLFFFNARSTRDAVQVTGAATQQFEADVAKWRLSLTTGASLDGLAAGYGTMSASVAQLRGQLTALGVADSAIAVQPPTANPRFDQLGQPTGYEVHQALYVVSSNVNALEELALNPGRLEMGPAALQGSSIEYYYDDLATLKHSLLAAATADARRRAEEIVERSGTGIGRMVAARAGVFQITEPYSTEVSDFGMHNTATRRQQITVTVHATFTLD
jgi:hypothetical protein